MDCRYNMVHIRSEVLWKRRINHLMFPIGDSVVNVQNQCNSASSLLPDLPIKSELNPIADSENNKPIPAST